MTAGIKIVWSSSRVRGLTDWHGHTESDSLPTTAGGEEGEEGEESGEGEEGVRHTISPTHFASFFRA